jgi:alpha-tubulin suppressor-like RCC1 family protein
MGIQTDGSLWGWGDNSFGQLGDATFASKKVPTLVSKDTRWRNISCGIFYSMGVQTDDSLWGWGINNSRYPAYKGRHFSQPHQLKKERRWKSVICGGSHALGVAFADTDRTRKL